MESKSLKFIKHQSFFSIVRSGDLDALKRWAESLNGEESSARTSISSFLSLQNDAGETALYVTAENNIKDMFIYLFELCDIQILTLRSKSDMNAFHVAAKRGHHGIVKQILSVWPEICNICDSSNTSPLYAAAVQGHLDVVNAILATDTSSARIVRKNGKTSLHTAARNGLVDVVKALIEKDPGMVSIKDRKGQAALHMAAKGKSTLVVEELLLADHSILNERDKKGNTALHVATRKCRPQVISLLLTYTSTKVNTINNLKETAMDLADKLQYGESAMEIREALTDAGGQNARHVGRMDETSELKRTVSDIKHEVYSQFLQNEKTSRRVSGIAKELKKLHRDAIQNTTNSITVVAVLFASIGFLSIFSLPGQYIQLGPEAGRANISQDIGFQLFFLLNAISLFISLAVVVVQITLVVWETRAQKMVVSVVNKLMWAACVSTCGAFLSVSYVVVGRKRLWLSVTVTIVGVPILVGTLFGMCCFAFRQYVRNFRSDSRRRIKRPSGSKSFSWSLYSVDVSDLDDDGNTDHEKIFVL